MIGPLEHRQGVRRIAFLGAEELLHSLDAAPRYLGEPHEIGNGTTGHKAKTIAQAAEQASSVVVRMIGCRNEARAVLMRQGEQRELPVGIALSSYRVRAGSRLPELGPSALPTWCFTHAREYQILRLLGSGPASFRTVMGLTIPTLYGQTQFGLEPRAESKER
jgi:hypothetical protein